MQKNDEQIAFVLPVGPGKDEVLDTLESVEYFCPEPHLVFIVDDQTNDGTYEALKDAQKPHWHIFRNKHRQGYKGIVHTMCFAFEQALADTQWKLVLKLDVDALIIKPGLISEAMAYMNSNPGIGMFGIYEVDYDRPRNFEAHKHLFDREAAWYRSLIGRQPSWKKYLRIAESKGYKRGDNVFGGAYFFTRECLEAAKKMGAFGISRHWRSKLNDEIYFSMIAVAAGFRLGHFAAPDGPLCMEWKGLPYPATTLAQSKYKVVHSVDKGKNTGPAENGGKTARGVFRELRNNVQKKLNLNGKLDEL
jgi:glycosyltransferase involved in cell wall biosynthesis